MNIVNTTPYVLLPFDCSPAPSIPALSLIVKGTFTLRPDKPAIPVDKNRQHQPRGDDMFLDDLGRSLRYANDLVPVKIRGEALVLAICHTPDGRPHTHVDVSIQIGPIKKTLRVTGDRVWSRDAQGEIVPSRPQPFEHLPLRWEHAFGGLNFPTNPLGRGIDALPDESGRTVLLLPNVEYLDDRTRLPNDRPKPAGFGPLSPMWEPRLSEQGTRDQRWAAFRAPLPPKDFRPSFYNAAPADQQLPEGYFRGDEEIVMTGLHREFPVYRAALPGKRLRLFLLVRQPQGAPSRFTEVEMRLDTVHIDMEAGEVILVWRRPVKTKHPAHPEIEACYLTEEDLAAEPLPIEAHEARYNEQRGPKEPPLDAALDQEIEQQMGEAKKTLRESKADPEVIRKVEQTKDPQEMLKILMDYAKEKIADAERLSASFKPPGG